MNLLFHFLISTSVLLVAFEHEVIGGSTKGKEKGKAGPPGKPGAGKATMGCVMGYHKWSQQVKGSKNKAKQKEQLGNAVRTGKAKSCRWDLHAYFNDHESPEQPKAHVCSVLTIGMAIETAHALHDRQRYDISMQALLDCFAPKKCYEGRGCTAEEVLDKIGVDELKKGGQSRSYGIFLHKNDYPNKFDPTSTKQMACRADEKGVKEKSATNGIDYELWERAESQKAKKQKRRNRIHLHRLNIFDMMCLIRHAPLLVITKTTAKMAAYKLNSKEELNNLDLAYDPEKETESHLLAFNHAFLVIGYVKPAAPNTPVYFLVKTCITGSSGSAWGYKGKGFMKMSTAEGGPLGFNKEVYQLSVSLKGEAAMTTAAGKPKCRDNN